MRKPQQISLQGQTMALAGLYQAIRLVQQTATGQIRDTRATASTLNSIFITSPDSVAQVYNGNSGLVIGLDLLLEQLGNESSRRDLQLTGYAVTLMHLERKLARQASLLDKISQGISLAVDNASDKTATEPATVTALASIYSDTVSTLTPRVIVKGEAGILTDPDSQSMVRALLLAGIRATVLWRQCGGSRCKIIFKRKAILQCARELQSGRVNTS